MVNGVLIEDENGLHINVVEGDRILFWKHFSDYDEYNPREGVVEEICSTKEFMKIKPYRWIEIRSMVIHSTLPVREKTFNVSDVIPLLILCVSGGLLIGLIGGMVM
jgi:hypothetical protein